jgi:predicted  nucleic acid-binding Zn-ribbon protein
MARSQLELLVLYQDINLMLQEAAAEVEQIGFQMEGKEQLVKARDELAGKIEPRFLRAYERLNNRYKRAIVPVQDDTCLGCFAKLPTSYTMRGREDKHIITCEECGRILYWVD